jgi:hypothetical protein
MIEVTTEIGTENLPKTSVTAKQPYSVTSTDAACRFGIFQKNYLSAVLRVGSVVS